MHGQWVVATVIGMSRQWIIAVVVVALLNGAGNASAARPSDAEKIDEKDARHEAREERRDAKEEAREDRHAPAAPSLPVAPPAEPPIVLAEVAAAPAHAGEAALRPSTSLARPPPFEDAPAAAARTSEASTPFPLAASGGAAAPGAPVWSPIGDAGAGAGGAAWSALLWSLPILGVGGVGAVLLMRRREGTPGMPLETMTPVLSTDLAGILRNGRSAVARDALDEAIAWFDAALRVAPKLAVAHFCKGVCLAANGRTAEAFGALDAAVRHAPEDASYRIHYARAALSLGKNKEALDALAFVARAMPDLGPAMLDDAALAGLRDHPRFLMMCGAL